MTVTALPRAAAATSGRAPRWQPSRAGILNVWRYYDEVFEFDSGRLLLRGPNGSGKSKALELLLPFLFDANLRANRLSTFGTAERTMHWNLMGEGATGATRVGYVWLEFELPGPRRRWFCCGARLQAGAHTTTVTADYFTTELRVDARDGVRLVNDAGQPITRGVLAERLGEYGTVHHTAGEYRAAVRATLFPTLTEQRYEALITALLQLRTPKLSQRLDPALLSTLLSRALPPLGQQEIGDLAEGFERLDAQRDRLARLADEVAATRVLARHQRTYAQRVLRAAAAEVVAANSQLDKLADDATAAAEEYAAVNAQLRTVREQIEELENASTQATASKEGLSESEAYQHTQELDRLRAQTTEALSRSRRARADAGAADADAETDRQSHADASEAADRVAETVAAQQAAAREAADRAGMVGVYDSLAAGVQSEADTVPRPLLRTAVRHRREQIDSVARALGEHERAVALRKHAETELESARGVFSVAELGRTETGDRRDRVFAELRAAVASWIGQCRELAFSDADALASLVESEPALIAEVHAIAAIALHDITRQEATVEAELVAARAQRAELADEVKHLETEQELPPPAPATRTADRSKMSGAPLWRLVDFAPDVSELDHAGIEAALEAAGLLDAWIGPRGQLEGHDVFADPYALAPVNHGGNGARSLADLLVPERDAGVDPGVVRRLLEAVGIEQMLSFGAGAAITEDGQWRMGSLSGSWHKDEAVYIGTASRVRARERRITELWARSEECEHTVTRLEQEIAAIAVRRNTIERELNTRPDHAALTAADAELAAATADRNAADTVVRGRVEAVATREMEVKTALMALSGLAAEHGVPTERAALTTLAGAVDTFGDAAESWLDEHARLLAARGQADLHASWGTRSAELAQRREREAADAEAQHSSLAAKLNAINGAVDVAYRDVLVQVTALRTTVTEITERLRAARAEAMELKQRLGSLETQRTTTTAAHDEAVAHRDAVSLRLRQLASGVFPADSEMRDHAGFQAALAASDSPDAALDAARRIAAAWPSVPHAPRDLGKALQQLSESVHECRAALSERADLELETDSDIQVFTATVDGTRVGAAQLLATLAGEAEQSRHEITEQERELFDQTLTGDTRRHLAARIRQANELVDAMNTRLERVRTASNVAVRLVWQVAADLPAETRAARDLLLKEPELLTDSDRESLHRFLRERIEEAKTGDTATSWEQQLAQVFDYTAWHQFVVKVDRAGGDGWQLLTKKLHGALSGGEKAIALHLPLFAAVAAHYQAAPEAPRVILLDEVFVGVDTVNRGQIFGLLSSLDLDLVLTSDHEWCTYAELSGISIHQLITGEDDDAVTTARFIWNGQDLITEP